MGDLDWRPACCGCADRRQRGHQPCMLPGCAPSHRAVRRCKFLPGRRLGLRTLGRSSRACCSVATVLGRCAASCRTAAASSCWSWRLPAAMVVGVCTFRPRCRACWRSAQPTTRAGRVVSATTAVLMRVAASLPLGEDLCGAIPAGGFATRSGTSGATPVVAGLAALLLSIWLARNPRRRIEADQRRRVRAAILTAVEPCSLTDRALCQRLLSGQIRPQRTLELLNPTR